MALKKTRRLISVKARELKDVAEGGESRESV
jgi:hypothetical protein